MTRIPRHTTWCSLCCNPETIKNAAAGTLVKLADIAPLIAALKPHQDLNGAPFGAGIDHDSAVRALRTLLQGAPS